MSLLLGTSTVCIYVYYQIGSWKNLKRQIVYYLIEIQYDLLYKKIDFRRLNFCFSRPDIKIKYYITIALATILLLY